MTKDDPENISEFERAQISYRLKWARSQKRFWYFDRASRQPTAEDPDWRSRWWPWFGSDEYGRKNLVFPIPFHGEIVWAFWTWKDEESNEMRDQTWEHETYELIRSKEFEDNYDLHHDAPFVDVRHNLDDCDLRWSMRYADDPEETVICAAYPMDWHTLRLYPIDDTDVTVTVRVEVAPIGTGITCITEDV